MSQIEWNKGLLRGIAFQDADHEEAVKLMNAMQTCSDDEFPALFAEHLAHIKAHFTREHELMERTGFFAIEYHVEEHLRVLDDLSMLQELLDTGEIEPVRAYVTDILPEWFLHHLNTMDMAIAHVAKQQGET